MDSDRNEAGREVSPWLWKEDYCAGEEAGDDGEDWLGEAGCCCWYGRLYVGVISGVSSDVTGSACWLIGGWLNPLLAPPALRALWRWCVCFVGWLLVCGIELRYPLVTPHPEGECCGGEL
jgi:hypothetical protein